MSNIKLDSNIDEFLSKLEGSLTKEMTTIATELLIESRNETPIDTGLLRNSGTARLSKEGGQIEVEIGYSADYAMIVHENYNSKHIVGNAGYLIGPYKRKEASIIKRITDKIKGLCGR